MWIKDAAAHLMAPRIRLLLGIGRRLCRICSVATWLWRSGASAVRRSRTGSPRRRWVRELQLGSGGNRAATLGRWAGGGREPDDPARVDHAGARPARSRRPRL